MAGFASNGARHRPLTDTAAGIGVRGRYGQRAQAHTVGARQFRAPAGQGPCSLLEGAVRPKELASLARQYRMPAVTSRHQQSLRRSTDRRHLGQGWRPADHPVTCPSGSTAPPSKAAILGPARPSISCAPGQGRDRLRSSSKLLSSAYLDVEPGELPHASAEKLAVNSAGLILLTGGPNGPINRLIATVSRRPPKLCSRGSPAGSAIGSTSSFSATPPNEAAVEES